MSEDKAEYTVHPDVAIRLQVAENYIKQLESTMNGYNMIQGRHAETITEQAARISELEQALHDTTAQLAQATETIARQEQDLRRLRWLDAMPLDAIERYVNEVASHRDWKSITEWLRNRVTQ